MKNSIKDCIHIFICANKKEQGRCCASGGADEIFEYFKSQIDINLPNLNPNYKYKVVKTSCLGRCSLGPNIFISPDNIWYNYVDFDDIDKIISKHLIQGEVVEELLQSQKINL